jgi:universal stress protein E
VNTFSNILVGVDLSNVDPAAGIEITPADDAALQCAILIASRSRARLTIFSSLNQYPYLHDALKTELDHSRLEKEAHRILGHFRTRALDFGVTAQVKLEFGAAWQEIILAVVGEKHDLVVAGTRDLSRAGRVLFGSTGRKLLRNCPCPVWIARPGTDWSHLNILVPSDLSEVSLEALRLAVNCGQIIGARIHVLHALAGPGAPPSWYGDQAKHLFNKFTVERRAEVARALEEQLAQAGGSQLPGDVPIHIAEGQPDEAILRAIEDLQIGLVVMGTAARAGLQVLTLGNTTERLVSQMQCSLLAVKPRGFECPISTLEKIAVAQIA